MSAVSRSDVDDAVDRAKRVASPLIERLARFGYAAKGVLYLAVAGLVALAAAGEPAPVDRPDTRGVLFFLDEGPLGSVVLALLAAGLAGHALWRFVQGVRDPERRCRGFVGALRRVSYLVRGLLHVALVITALQLLFDAATRRAGVKDWSAEIMRAVPPFGAWIVGAAGVAVVAYAIDSVHKVWTARLRKELDLSGLREPWRVAVLVVCRFGVTSRAVLLGAVGGFIVLAAFREDPAHAKGFGDALRALPTWRHGGALLAVFAAGLVAYSFQELFKAARRDITPI